MDLIFVLIAFLVGIGFFLWIGRQQPKSDKHPLDGATKHAVLDVNKDGKVDAKDVTAAVEVVVEEVKVVAEKTKQATKKAKANVEQVVEKVKKPRSKKTTKTS